MSPLLQLAVAVLLAGGASCAALDTKDKIRDGDPLQVLSAIGTVFCVVVGGSFLYTGLGAL